MGSSALASDAIEEKVHQVLIQRLKDELSMPEDQVREIYIQVLASLMEGARIKTFIPLLTWRKVREFYHPRRL